MKHQEDFSFIVLARNRWGTLAEFNEDISKACKDVIERGDSILNISLHEIETGIREKEIPVPELKILAKPLELVVISATNKEKAPERVEKQDSTI